MATGPVPAAMAAAASRSACGVSTTGGTPSRGASSGVTVGLPSGTASSAEAAAVVTTTKDRDSEG